MIFLYCKTFCLFYSVVTTVNTVKHGYSEHAYNELELTAK